jgi:hypothetical protein
MRHENGLDRAVGSIPPAWAVLHGIWPVHHVSVRRGPGVLRRVAITLYMGPLAFFPGFCHRVPRGE